MQNQLAEAIYRYRRTLEIEPDRVGALLDLAWIIATAPNVELRVPAEAVRLAERAVRLTERRRMRQHSTRWPPRMQPQARPIARLQPRRMR